MRATVMLSAGVALMTASGVWAQPQQGPGAPYPQPGRHVVPGPGVHHPQPPQVRQSRWGSQVGGRWWGGANAPGGWAAYRQPHRGYRVPAYWVAPRFHVTDWQRYGLPQPWAGYNWVRYYDDAVLIDRGGSVADWRGGLDWEREEYAGGGSSGVGGAVAGAVVGGVAGNLIAGRGDRLGGTLIGAGVGAAAGYAIDRNSGRDRYRRRDNRGAPPPLPSYGDEEYRVSEGSPPPMRDERRERRDVIVESDGPGQPHGYPYGPDGPSTWRSADGRTTVTTTMTGGYGAPVIVAPAPAYGYHGGYGYQGAYAYGGAVTTITVASAPIVTTTTTEIIEDHVTYTRPVVRRAVRRVHRAPVRRARPRCICR